MRVWRIVQAVSAAFAVSVGSANAQVVVSSKIDTEGGILGNIIMQVLEASGIPVADRIQLGGTPVVREAMAVGQIDIYPEYTGNAAFFFDRADEPLWNDAALAYEEAARLDLETNNIVWLRPAPANNTWGIAVRSEVAAENGLVTMSDFGAWVAGGGDVKLVASAEFVSSPTALPRFQSAYGFVLEKNQLVTLSSGDTATTVAAAAEHTRGVNAAMVYGTDGSISASRLVVMEDDRGVQPVYEPAPIVRKAVLDQYPQIRDLLEPVFEELDLVTLRELNGRVQLGGEAAAAVARDWLLQQGFVE